MSVSTMLAEEEQSQIEMEELLEAVQKIQLEKNQYIYSGETLKGRDDNISSCAQKRSGVEVFRGACGKTEV